MTRDQWLSAAFRSDRITHKPHIYYSAGRWRAIWSLPSGWSLPSDSSDALNESALQWLLDQTPSTF